MRMVTQQVRITTDAPVKLVDISQQVAAIVEESGVRQGVALVATQHTTSAIRVNEPCEHLAEDLAAFFERLVPRRDIYRHNVNGTDGRPNAHSHLLAWLMGASESVPVQEGKLQLGRWQSLFFVELDGPRPERSVTVTVIGE